MPSGAAVLACIARAAWAPSMMKARVRSCSSQLGVGEKSIRLSGLEVAACGQLEREFEQALGQDTEAGVARLGGAAAAPARMQLLKDHGRLERGQGAVKAEVAQVASGELRVIFRSLASVHEARLCGRHLLELVHGGRIAGFGPVAQQGRQIEQAVTTRALVPVEQGYRFQGLRMQQQVVELEVVVQQRGRPVALSGWRYSIVPSPMVRRRWRLHSSIRPLAELGSDRKKQEPRRSITRQYRHLPMYGMADRHQADNQPLAN